MTTLAAEYEVVVTYGNVRRVFPVKGWAVKGASLVPIYDNGLSPEDEHPQADVRLRCIY